MFIFRFMFFALSITAPRCRPRYLLEISEMCGVSLNLTYNTIKEKKVNVKLALISFNSACQRTVTQ